MLGLHKPTVPSGVEGRFSTRYCMLAIQTQDWSWLRRGSRYRYTSSSRKPESASIGCRGSTSDSFTQQPFGLQGTSCSSIADSRSALFPPNRAMARRGGTQPLFERWLTSKSPSISPPGYRRADVRIKRRYVFNEEHRQGGVMIGSVLKYGLSFCFA